MSSESAMPELLTRAHHAARAGRLVEADEIIAGILRAAPDEAGAWLLRSQIALQFHQFERSLESATRAVQLAPADGASWYALGRACKAAGVLERAIECYQRSLEVGPPNPDVLTSLGIAMRAAGRAHEAIAAYRQALAIAPGHTTAHHNLANALEALGAPAAEALLHRSAGRPGLRGEVEAGYQQGHALRAQGKLPDALAVVDAALQIAPRAPALLSLAATLSTELGHGSQALDYYERILEHDAADMRVLSTAARLAAGAGLLQRARAYAQRVVRIEPCDELTFVLRLALPAIYASAAALLDARRSYAAELEELARADLHLSDPLAIPLTSFWLAYQGQNDRELLGRLGQLFLGAAPQLAFTAAHCARAPRRPGRVRIGFVSAFMHAHSIGKTTLGLIEKLDRSRFEVYLIRIVPSQYDGTTARMAAAASVVEIDGNGSLERAHAQLAALELDVLFYQDIGMERVSYFLSFARLAPLQCVSFGHPNTTGVPNMDCFISNDLYETAESPQQYSERLVLLRGLPTLAYYYRPPAPAGRRNRGDFRLPQSGTLYLCPQTLFKLHPDFDRLLRGILERDPRGYLVLVRGQYAEWEAALRERFAVTLGALSERVLFIDSVPAEDFLELLGLGDVMLDPPHFNGMNSSLEAFAVGLPIVTLPTGLQRGRHTRAMYLCMGIADCIATDEATYIELAVRLGTDPAFNAFMRARILEHNHVLYEDPRVVREFERFFLTELRERGIPIDLAGPAEAGGRAISAPPETHDLL
jgi:predicted O-linked N-acetylglucosamine transferase (SPINDLY family)